MFRKSNPLVKSLASLIILAFTANICLPAYAQSVFTLPAPGVMIAPSAGFVPTLIKGITIHPENPLAYDFIIDNGNSGLEGEALSEESNKLIKYFLASLTVPENELWVNLSPYEKERITTDSFGRTEMGRDLLGQDYILKQLTASLMYPESDLGKEFWKRVHAKAWAQFGTIDVPVNTFNKVWIVPQEAVVYEHENSAFVVSSKLKVMLEEDYKVLQDNRPKTIDQRPETQDNTLGLKSQVSGRKSQESNAIGSQIVREIIIPEIEKEVNEGKNFANLRQIYNSMILSAWFKNNLQQSLLGQVYVDKNKVKGVDSDDPAVKEKIYQQYLEAYKKGVYNYVKEEVDPRSEDLVPRKYFSGGFMARSSSGVTLNQMVASSVVRDNASAILAGKPTGKVFKANVSMGATSASSSVTPGEDPVLNKGNFDKWMTLPQTVEWRITPAVLKQIAELRENQKQYLYLLEIFLPAIYRYAQWILDNKEYEGKKIIVLGRSAEPLYIAMKAIAARNSAYTKRIDDVQIIDFSQELVGSFIRSGKGTVNQMAYSKYLREQLSYLGANDDFSNLVFVAEHESPNSTAQQLLGVLLAKNIGSVMPVFKYTAGFTTADEDTEQGYLYNEETQEPRPEWSWFLDTQYASGRQYAIEVIGESAQHNYSKKDILQTWVNFSKIAGYIPKTQVKSASSAVKIIRDSVAALVIALSAASPQNVSAVTEQFAATYRANQEANHRLLSAVQAKTELNVNLDIMIQEQNNINKGHILPEDFNAPHLKEVLKDLKTPTFDAIRQLTANALQSAKDDAARTALINEMIAWVNDLLHKAASDETDAIRASGEDLHDNWQRLIVDRGQGRKFVSNNISEAFVMIMSDLMGGDYDEMISWALSDGNTLQPDEVEFVVMVKQKDGEVKFIDVAKGNLNAWPQQLILRDLNTADQFVTVTLGSDRVEARKILADYVGNTAKNTQDLMTVSAEALKLVDMLNSLQKEQLTNNNYEEIKGRVHDIMDRYNRLSEDASSFVQNNPLTRDLLMTIKQAIVNDIQALGEFDRQNSPEQILGEALSYYVRTLMAITRSAEYVKALDVPGSEDDAQNLSDQIRTQINQALNALRALPDMDVKIRLVLKSGSDGPETASKDITRDTLIKDFEDILKELKPLKSTKLDSTSNSSSASSAVSAINKTLAAITLGALLSFAAPDIQAVSADTAKIYVDDGVINERNAGQTIAQAKKEIDVNLDQMFVAFKQKFADAPQLAPWLKTQIGLSPTFDQFSARVSQVLKSETDKVKLAILQREFLAGLYIFIASNTQYDTLGAKDKDKSIWSLHNTIAGNPRYNGVPRTVVCQNASELVLILLTKEFGFPSNTVSIPEIVINFTNEKMRDHGGHVAVAVTLADGQTLLYDQAQGIEGGINIDIAHQQAYVKRIRNIAERALVSVAPGDRNKTFQEYRGDNIEELIAHKDFEATIMSLIARQQQGQDFVDTKHYAEATQLYESLIAEAEKLLTNPLVVKDSTVAFSADVFKRNLESLIEVTRQNVKVSRVGENNGLIEKSIKDINGLADELKAATVSSNQGRYAEAEKAFLGIAQKAKVLIEAMSKSPLMNVTAEDTSYRSSDDKPIDASYVLKELRGIQGVAEHNAGAARVNGGKSVVNTSGATTPSELTGELLNNYNETMNHLIAVFNKIAEFVNSNDIPKAQQLSDSLDGEIDQAAAKFEGPLKSLTGIVDQQKRPVSGAFLIKRFADLKLKIAQVREVFALKDLESKFNALFPLNSSNQAGIASLRALMQEAQKRSQDPTISDANIKKSYEAMYKSAKKALDQLTQQSSLDIPPVASSSLTDQTILNIDTPTQYAVADAGTDDVDGFYPVIINTPSASVDISASSALMENFRNSIAGLSLLLTSINAAAVSPELAKLFRDNNILFGYPLTELEAAGKAYDRFLDPMITAGDHPILFMSDYQLYYRKGRETIPSSIRDKVQNFPASPKSFDEVAKAMRAEFSSRYAQLDKGEMPPAEVQQLADLEADVADWLMRIIVVDSQAVFDKSVAPGAKIDKDILKKSQGHYRLIVANDNYWINQKTFVCRTFSEQMVALGHDVGLRGLSLVQPTTDEKGESFMHDLLGHENVLFRRVAGIPRLLDQGMSSRENSILFDWNFRVWDSNGRVVISNLRKLSKDEQKGLQGLTFDQLRTDQDAELALKRLADQSQELVEQLAKSPGQDFLPQRLDLIDQAQALLQTEYGKREGMIEEAFRTNVFILSELLTGQSFNALGDQYNAFRTKLIANPLSDLPAARKENEKLLGDLQKLATKYSQIQVLNEDKLEVVQAVLKDDKLHKLQEAQHKIQESMTKLKTLLDESLGSIDRSMVSKKLIEDYERTRVRIGNLVYDVGFTADHYRIPEARKKIDLVRKELDAAIARLSVAFKEDIRTTDQASRATVGEGLIKELNDIHLGITEAEQVTDFRELELRFKNLLPFDANNSTSRASLDEIQKTVETRSQDPQIAMPRLKIEYEKFKKRIQDARNGINETDAPAVSSAVDPVGGINLDPKFLNLQIKRDANGIPLPLIQQPINNMNIDGFYPVIINITPVASLPLLLSSSK